MISLNNARIFLCTDDTDMRKSFSSLSGVVRKSMNLDPFSGYLFVFKNKRADRIKLMYFERDGMALWYKVLNKGTFKFVLELGHRRRHRAQRRCVGDL